MDHHYYFWKVKAEDNHGSSTFSHQKFQFFTFAAPLPFKLESPVTEDTVSIDTVHFKLADSF